MQLLFRTDIISQEIIALSMQVTLCNTKSTTYYFNYKFCNSEKGLMATATTKSSPHESPHNWEQQEQRLFSV